MCKNLISSDNKNILRKDLLIEKINSLYTKMFFNNIFLSYFFWIHGKINIDSELNRSNCVKKLPLFGDRGQEDSWKTSVRYVKLK